MRQRHADLAARDAVVLVIFFDAARRVGGYCRRHQLPFRCLVDEARDAYRAYGLTRGSWRQTLTPRALTPYVRRFLSGRPVRAADRFTSFVARFPDGADDEEPRPTVTPVP